MLVLIVENNPDLGKVWKSHLERQGAVVQLESCEESAVQFLTDNPVDIIVLNIDLDCGSALPIADFAAYRHPDARVIFVTNSTFFTDGSIFAHASNACAFLPTQTAPEDLAALVEHHGRARPAAE